MSFVVTVYVAWLSCCWNSFITKYTDRLSNYLPRQNLLFNSRWQIPALISCVNIMKYEAWSLSKSQIYFNFLLSLWDEPSAPAGLAEGIFQCVPHASEMNLRVWILKHDNASPYWNINHSSKMAHLLFSTSKTHFQFRLEQYLGLYCQFLEKNGTVL